MRIKEISFEFRDFTKDLGYFKEFMRVRDTNPLFDEVKAKGGIGMPCLLMEDGEWRLDWEEVV